MGLIGDWRNWIRDDADGTGLGDDLDHRPRVTTSELRRLGTDGKIGRAELLGLTTQMERLRKEAGDMPGTIQDGFTLLRNALLEYVGTGDAALGISARIAEALTLIADNFDTVADAGLKLAAVLAAGMLGRSIVGMVAKLGGATTAVVAFGKALRAAMAMGSVTMAINGLSAAAGPLGMILGGLPAGGVLLYSQRAQEAERRTADMRDILAEMGLSVAPVAASIDNLGNKVNGIGSADQLEKIRKLRDGLLELKGPPEGWPFFDASQIADQIIALRRAGEIGRKQDGSAAVAELAEMAAAWQRGDEAAGNVLQKVREMSALDLSKGARAAVVEISRIVQEAEAARAGLAALGDTKEIDELKARIDALVESMNLSGLDETVARSMDRIIEKFGKGEVSADQAAEAMRRLGDTSPGFGAAFAQIAQMIGALANLEAAADSARAALAAARLGNDDRDRGTKQRRSGMSVNQEEYFAEQRRWNALSSEQQALEKSAARHFDAAAKANGAITREMAMQLAIEEAAADARRSAGGKGGGGGGGKGRGSRGDNGREAPGIFEGTARDLANLEREITLIGKSAAEVAKARAAWAMLDEAKKAGIPINAQVTAQIEAQAEKVGRLTAQLEAGELKQQQFEQAVDDIADAFANALVAGESLRKGLAQVFAGIASDLARSGIQKLLSQIMGSVGGAGAGDVLTGVLQAIGLSARASGGPVTAGQPYMVGERGPEPFVPAVNGRILSVAQAQAALRGGQGGPGGVVRLEIVEAPGFAATVRAEVQGVAINVSQQAVGAYDRALPTRVQQINAKALIVPGSIQWPAYAPGFGRVSFEFIQAVR